MGGILLSAEKDHNQEEPTNRFLCGGDSLRSNLMLLYSWEVLAGCDERLWKVVVMGLLDERLKSIETCQLWQSECMTSCIDLAFL